MTAHIGLTGGIGSGKTVVANHFASLGVQIIDADLIARQAIELPSVRQAIRKLMGNDVFDKRGHVIRVDIKQKIFHDCKLLQDFNAIMHPIISKVMRQQIEESVGNYAIVVVPLLYETIEQYSELTRIIMIEITQQRQQQFVMQRDGMSIDMINKIVNSQATDEQKRQISDDIIQNTGSLEYLKLKVEQLHQTYQQMFAKNQ